MSIRLEGLAKSFSGQPVVKPTSLEVRDGELFVLLVASGSGKSTILRMVAGLTAPDGGRIWLHDKDVTRLAPQERGIGFVFQNYSIFRHMSVGENIEFPLKIRKMPAAERARKREELLDRVGLGGGVADEHEGITVIELPLAELAAMADAGQIIDMKTLAVVQTLRLRKPELFVTRPPPSETAA